MDLADDEHLDVCQNIEAGLKQVYEHHADLTDAICLFVLENAKIAIPKHFGFSRNDRGTHLLRRRACFAGPHVDAGGARIRIACRA